MVPGLKAKLEAANNNNNMGERFIMVEIHPHLSKRQSVLEQDTKAQIAACEGLN